MRPTSLLVTIALAAPLAIGDEPPTRPGDATLGARPPAGAVVLFDGKGLDGWVKLDGKTPAAWPVADGTFAVGKGQGGIMTARRFGDVKLHIEFNVPYMPKAKGQARGNSGVYLAGAHEVQVLDSYGLKPGDDDCAAVYKQVAPKVNACKPPLQWQTYDITFRRARKQNGVVQAKARITVAQNGLTVIDDAEIVPTPGGVGVAEGDEGPLMLQDHGNDVQFRNVWIQPL